MTLLERYSATVRFDGYEAIRQALFDPNLSRSFDKRSYAEGNIRDGVVSVSHGPMQRARRRVENTQFRPDRLRLYERELFPKVLADLLDVLIDDTQVDVFAVGELLSVVLAARRAGPFSTRRIPKPSGRSSTRRTMPSSGNSSVPHGSAGSR
jgi:cytochrome P450